MTLAVLRVRWTEDGRERALAVSYDEASAQHRKKLLEAEGGSDVRVIPVKPGE
ncbi:hypothetical protein [Streptomyces sp. MS1.AVA.4]|uniref:Uncharacterized protein n=1 Tax=Streptomyces pratisoli TaxID=3139917 RepID=A0ACC6QUS8_9ACTN